MKKLIIVSMIGGVALVVIAKKTNVFSYASTLVASVERDAQNQIPTKFELERIRHEIANLDSDVSQMIRPIAEYKADIERLRKEIAKAQVTHEQKKADLLVVVAKLEGNPKFVNCGGKEYPAERVRQQVQRESDNLKRDEKNVKARQDVLDAKEVSLKATQEQLGKVVSKKREYEVRLAQLEAMDQSLQVAKIGSTIKVDSSRATQIEEALQGLEKRLITEGEVLKMQTNPGDINLFEREPEPTDINAIRSYLEGGERVEKAVSNR